MKKLIFILLIFVSLNSCSSDSENPEIVEEENKAPTVPILSSPENNLFCTSSELEFKWLPSTDPENDQVSYLVEIAPNSNFSNIYFTQELSQLSVSTGLEKGQNYYWRVKAKDSDDNYSSYSEIRDLYTEDEVSTNLLPSVPELLYPTENTVSRTQVELSWKATDPDEDTLTFDLYFGTSESPNKLEENLTQTSYVVNNLTTGTTYFWKIAVKDNQGGKTIGQIWNFKVN